MNLDNCDEAGLIRQGGRDRSSTGIPRSDLTKLSAIEQQAYRRGFDELDGWERLLCPCLNMTHNSCAGECGRQDSIALQREYFEAN